MKYMEYTTYDYAVILLVPSVIVMAIAMLRQHRRLRVLLTQHNRRLSLHDDQLSIARDLLVEHHHRHGFTDHTNSFIWDDTDDILPTLYDQR